MREQEEVARIGLKWGFELKGNPIGFGYKSKQPYPLYVSCGLCVSCSRITLLCGRNTKHIVSLAA